MSMPSSVARLQPSLLEAHQAAHKARWKVDDAERRVLRAARRWWAHLAAGRSPNKGSPAEVAAWGEESTRRKEMVLLAIGLDAEARAELKKAQRSVRRVQDRVKTAAAPHCGRKRNP